MNVDLTFNNTTGEREYSRDFFVKILEKSFEIMSLPYSHYGLSLNIVSAEKMSELNNQYRHKNKPTDVLSFPLHESVGAINFHGDILELGDMFICLQVANKKARESRRDLNDEVKFLVVHGLLHLLGYDHEKSSKDEGKMFSLQNKILAII